jgi:hypothetical protein
MSEEAKKEQLRVAKEKDKATTKAVENARKRTYNKNTKENSTADGGNAGPALLDKVNAAKSGVVVADPSSVTMSDTSGREESSVDNPTECKGKNKNKHASGRREEPSDMAKRAQQKAGDTEKIGVDGIGCIHCGMEQRRKFVIHKANLKYYMGEDQLLFGTRCAGTCGRLPSHLTRKEDKDHEGNLIRFCDYSNKIQEIPFCPWHCTTCYEEEVKREAELMEAAGNGGRSKRLRRSGEK